jgi:hypothetical protein
MMPFASNFLTRHDMKAAARRLLPMALVPLWLTLMGCIMATPLVISLERPGDFYIRGTIYVSLAYWAVALALMLDRNPSARIAWALACCAYLVHVAMAFEWAHHWSHAAAFQHVKDASGFGEGIFVSYLFTLVWCGDALWWWIAPASRETRPRWVEWLLHGFMVFIIFNATVVF